MLKDKPIVQFAVGFLLSYFILTAAVGWMGLDKGLNGFFRSLSKITLNASFSELKFNTKPERQNGILDDNKMIVEFEWTQDKIDDAIQEARRTGQANLEVPYRFISYQLFEFFIVPLLFLLALIIGTPMQWKKKLKYGAISIGIMILFLLLKLYIMTLFSVSKARIDVAELGDSMMNFLLTMVSLMTMGFSIILAFFLWLIFVFRRSELRTLMMTWFNSLSERVNQ